jgi:hypothetical protein
MTDPKCSSCGIECGENDLDEYRLCDSCSAIASSEHWFDDDNEDADDDTGYSPEDRETLRKDFEYQLYQQTYYADGEIVHDYPSDAQIAADESEDMEFRRCGDCGQLDCLCEVEE